MEQLYVDDRISDMNDVVKRGLLFHVEVACVYDCVFESVAMFFHDLDEVRAQSGGGSYAGTRR